MVEIKKIKEICKLINGRGFKPHEWKKRGLPIIRIQNLNGSKDYNYYDGSYNPKILVKKGELLFAWSGSRGTSFGPHIWKYDDGVLNYHTWKIIVNNTLIDKKFFYHTLKLLTKNIEDNAHGASALVHIQKSEMENIQIKLPNKHEQIIISEVLSDTDDLILSLEKLINKKKLIKQGTMQQLLTGKKRLDGFKGEWSKFKMSELATFYSGGTPLTSNPKYYSGNIKWITSSDLNQKYIDSVDGKISELGLKNSSAKMINKGTLLLALYGATAGVVAISNISAAINQAVLAINTNKLASNKFLFQWFMMKKEWIIATYTQGGQPNLSGDIIKNIEIIVPELDEQEAIANILLDMDREIEALQKKLDKYKKIKEGMMEELLTGKRRLV